MVYAFDDQDQRKRWSNFPIAMVPRGGINMGEMSAIQRTAVMALLASVLSPRGIEKVQQIMEGDEINKTTDQGPGGNGEGPGGADGGGPPGNGGPPPGNSGPPFGPGGRRGAGGNGPMFGRDLYYVSFLGMPSEKNPWMLQIGGHHLALNVTIAGEHGVLTPTLTGAQPALYTVDGKTVRPWAGKATKLLHC